MKRITDLKTIEKIFERIALLWDHNTTMTSLLMLKNYMIRKDYSMYSDGDVSVGFKKKPNGSLRITGFAYMHVTLETALARASNFMRTFDKQVLATIAGDRDFENTTMSILVSSGFARQVDDTVFELIR